MCAELARDGEILVDERLAEIDGLVEPVDGLGVRDDGARLEGQRRHGQELAEDLPHERAFLAHRVEVAQQVQRDVAAARAVGDGRLERADGSGVDLLDGDDAMRRLRDVHREAESAHDAVRLLLGAQQVVREDGLTFRRVHDERAARGERRPVFHPGWKARAAEADESRGAQHGERCRGRELLIVRRGLALDLDAALRAANDPRDARVDGRAERVRGGGGDERAAPHMVARLYDGHGRRADTLAQWIIP